MNVGNIGSSSIEQFISNQRPPSQTEGAPQQRQAEAERLQASEALVRSAPAAPKEIPTFDPERRIGANIDVTA